MNRDLFNFWLPVKKKSSFNIRSFNINFGPQHPAAHGVLRIILQLRGEIIERGDTHIGLLHRGTEKLVEERPYLLGLPYFDRLDYTAMLMQEHAYCLAIENILGSNNYLSPFSNFRILFDELTRILNHLTTLSTHSMDVGTMAVFFWAFEERERIMEFYERISGARMHVALYRPNELTIRYITSYFLKDIVFFCRDILKRIGQIESRLNTTTIWRARLVNIGIIYNENSFSWGITGPLARSAGLRRDLRLNYAETYGNYYYLTIRSFIGENGDCYDRFLIRMREMVESIHIILQIISNWFLNYNTWYSYFMQTRNHSGGLVLSNFDWWQNMEKLIDHFKYFSDGFNLPAGLTYQGIESAKGEFGVLMLTDGSAYPYRCRIRSPAYYHTQFFLPMTQGHYFADLVTIIGSQDIVMGEVDRISIYQFHSLVRSRLFLYYYILKYYINYRYFSIYRLCWFLSYLYPFQFNYIIYLIHFYGFNNYINQLKWICIFTGRQRGIINFFLSSRLVLLTKFQRARYRDIKYSDV